MMDGQLHTAAEPAGILKVRESWLKTKAAARLIPCTFIGKHLRYAHASARMRDDLKTALQARWEESLHARAAISPRSPVPLLDELLAPFRGRTRQPARAPRATRQQAPEDKEKMISQIPPKHGEGPTPAIRVEPVLRASDLARYQESASGARGTRTPDPVLAKHVLFQLSYSPALVVKYSTTRTCYLLADPRVLLQIRL